jgi:hypothetical protein
LLEKSDVSHDFVQKIFACSTNHKKPNNRAQVMVRFKKFLEEQIKAGQFHNMTWTMLGVKKFWEKATVSHILLGKLKFLPGTTNT